jgi:hypothetical protein
MARRWLENGERVRVKCQEEYNWQLRGDPLPDGVFGRAGTIIPVRSVQGLQVSGDRLLPLVFIQLDDSRTFMIHQDNLELV